MNADLLDGSEFELTKQIYEYKILKEEQKELLHIQKSNQLITIISILSVALMALISARIIIFGMFEIIIAFIFPLFMLVISLVGLVNAAVVKRSFKDWNKYERFERPNNMDLKAYYIMMLSEILEGCIKKNERLEKSYRMSSLYVMMAVMYLVLGILAVMFFRLNGVDADLMFVDNFQNSIDSTLRAFDLIF